jgi:hypothetical protein
MSSKKKIDHATPVAGPSTTNAEKVTTTQTHFNAMKASPDWANAPEVQKAAADWLVAANNLAQNDQDLQDLLKQVAAKRSAELLLLLTWTTQKEVCLAAVKKYCGGSSSKVQGFGYGVAGRTPHPPAVTPFNLLTKRAKVAGVATVLWTVDAHRHQYQVQWATDPTNAATYSPLHTVSRRRFQLTGQTTGAVLHFRVLVLDPKLPLGQSDWSAWVTAVVS